MPVIILGFFEITKEIQIIISYIFGYFILFLWSTMAIKDQENYLAEKEMS